MLQRISVSFTERSVNSNRPTCSCIAENRNLYQRRCRHPKYRVNSIFAEGQLHWWLTVHQVMSPARYTRYSKTNRCTWLRLIRTTDFTAGPSYKNDNIFHVKITKFTFAITKLITVKISKHFLLTCITVWLWCILLMDSYQSNESPYGIYKDFHIFYRVALKDL